MDLVQARMRAALELRELTISLRRQALAREHPGASAAEIEALLRAWVLQPEPLPAASGHPPERSS